MVFQIGSPEGQRNWFRILWFGNNDVDKGKIVAFRFTRHPGGIKKQFFYCYMGNFNNFG